MGDTQEITRTDRPPAAPPWPRAGDRRRRSATRVDPVAVLLAVGSLLLCAGFVAVSLAYDEGQLIPPLDDVYIHLQYGRQMGLGEPFRYLPGEPVTSGASSPLYVLLLGVAFAVGFHGQALLVVAVLCGALCAAATTVLTYLTGRQLGGVAVGRWAGVLVCLSGPLLWGAVSGMEVGLLAALLAGSLYAFVREQPRGRFPATTVLAALLALTRPEGLVVALGLVAAMVWTVVRITRADLRPWRPAAVRIACAVLPLVAGLAPSAFFLVTTGTAEANGVAAKSWLNQGLLLQPLEVADQTLRNLREMAATLAGLSGQDVVPPATLAFAVLGIVALGFGRPGRRTVAAVLAFGLVGVLVSVATLSTAQWQDLRYLQPFLPMLLLTAVLGVDALAGWGGHRHRVALHGLLAVALLFTVLATPTWALRLGQQASAMREGPVSIADWIARTVPPGDSVAVNDVGAAAWFGGHRTVDLVGLTTDGMAAPALNGAGTMYEALRHMPPGGRPDWFVVFDRWSGVPVGDLKRARVLGDQPVRTFGLAGPARPISPTAPQTCQIDHSCERVDAWRADWGLAGSGDLPDLPVPGRLRDHLNVGDMDDEARHGWTPQPPVLGAQPVSTVDAGQVAPGRTVVDSGRRIVGGETFTLEGLTPGRAVAVTGRLGAGPARTGANEADVRVDGAPFGPWTLPERPPGTWAQSTFVVPAERVTSSRITISIGPREEFLGPYPDYTSYGWWASQ